MNVHKPEDNLAAEMQAIGNAARQAARGPVGAEQLTTFKYVVRGDGQTRP